MKKYLTNTLAGILISTASNLYSQNRSIEFEKDTIWENILEKAKKEDKLIFLDAYTDWCIPCKWMSANVFTNDSVADFYNENFINVKTEMEKTGTGKRLAKKYQINRYPTSLYIDEKGEVNYKHSGSLKSQEFIELGKKAMKLEKEISEFERQKKSERSAKLTLEHVLKLKAASRDYGKILEDYFKTQKEEDLTSRINWELIRLDERKNKIDSREFKYVLKNIEKFDSLYTSSAVYTEILNSYIENLNSINDSIDYEEWKRKVKNSGFPDSSQVLADGGLRYNYKKENWEEYAKNAILAIDSLKMYFTDPIKLNNVAWDFYENLEKREYLEKALNWAKRSTQLKIETYNHDTYATLLYVLGKKEEAIKAEETALNLEKMKNHPNTEPYIEKLQKMKNGEKIKK